MTFKDFMSQFKDVDSPMGDFARDINRDRSFPVHEQNHPRLEMYFDHQSRIQQNFDLPRLFQIAWTFYEELYNPPVE